MEGLLVSHVKERLSGAVYVGRAVPRSGLTASPFANPTRIGERFDRATAIRRYHHHLLDRPDLVARLPELRGKTVACWCRRSDEPRTKDNVCHGDVLDLWLRYVADGTLRWLDGHAMPAGWAGELEARLEELLGIGVPTARSAGGGG